MAKVLLGSTISLDGFINDRNGSVEQLYPDLVALRQTEMLKESIRTTGAVVMGKRAYDMAQGDFTGYEYQVPIFVLTHTIPKGPVKGENSRLKINFVTDGIASAVEKAKAAAGNKYVTVIGGASIAQQIINAGLFDEIQIGIVPVILGEGLRLFEHLSINRIHLEKIRVLESPGRTDLRYRVVKDN